MRRLRRLRHRLRSLLRPGAVERELERELALHLELLEREAATSGLDPQAARLDAHRAFGSAALTADRCRDTRRLGLLHDLARDVGYAWRLLVRAPAFTVTALLSLAVGLGGTTAMFAVMEAALWRTLPVERPHDLVFVQVEGSAGRGGAPPYPCFERLRDAAIFDGLAAFASDELRVEVDGRIEQVFGQVASGDYFEVLGVRPHLGRLLTGGDERLDPAVAVISHGYWQRRFGGAPDVVGRGVRFRDRVFTIVGVTPPSFTGLQPGRTVDLTVPITLDRALTRDPGTWWFEAVGLTTGGRVAEATARADAIFQAFMRDHTPSAEMRASHFARVVLPSAARGLDRLRTRFATPLLVLGGVAAAILLMACLNVGHLVLARGAARQRELAIRTAAGAGAGRLLRQLVTETLLLYSLGGVAALAVAHVTIRSLQGYFAVGRQPIELAVRYDGVLFAFAAGITLLAGLLTAVWPARRALTTDVLAAIKGGDARIAGAGRVGGRLLAGQVAISMALVIAAAMFVRTIVALRAVDLGFSPRGVLTMSLDPQFDPSDASPDHARFRQAVLERIERLPGVRSASLSIFSPLSGRDRGRMVHVTGFEPRSELDRVAAVNQVSPGFFRTFDIEIVAGRTFDERDRTLPARVVIVNEAAVRRYFGGRSPLGELMMLGGLRPRSDGQGPEDRYQVVGVVRDAKHMNIRRDTPPFVFLPIPAAGDPGGTRITLAIAADLPAEGLSRAVAEEVRRVHGPTLVSDTVSADDQVDATLLTERLLAAIATTCAALALGLAAIGLFGSLSYAVARRRAEIGLRMALGAAPAQVVRSVIRDVLPHLAGGLGLGLAAGWATARLAEALLFGVAPGDPATYLGAAALLAVVAVVAAWQPARRAASVDPADVLRRG